MKKWWVNILFLWGMLILAPGCIKENFDDCFQGPYEIYFLYNGNGTTDIFNSKIETVQLYVFDTDGGYVDRYAVSKAALHEFQGIRPDLQPGAYEVVCWGNVTALSEITGGKAPSMNISCTIVSICPAGRSLILILFIMDGKLLRYRYVQPDRIRFIFGRPILK